MKQKLKRFMAGFMAMLTLVGTLFTNGTTAFAASPQANIAFWNASVKNSGEVSELKPGYNHGKILYSRTHEKLETSLRTGTVFHVSFFIC